MLFYRVYFISTSGYEKNSLKLFDLVLFPLQLKLICSMASFIYASTMCFGHYHHYVVPPARISLTPSRHFSLPFIASGRSSGLHPVSSQSCCMYVQAGRSAFARPYVGVHRSTSLMSSPLLRAASTDIPDPLSPLLPINHRLWQVFRATPRIIT